jgi:hypothetical protein
MVSGIGAYQQQISIQQSVSPREPSAPREAREQDKIAAANDRVEFSREAERSAVATDSARSRTDERDTKRANDELIATSQSTIGGKESAQKRGSLLDVIA